jgi:hypothetical protein
MSTQFLEQLIDIFWETGSIRLQIHTSHLYALIMTNNCAQANSAITSVQESQNNRKNVRRLRSTCHQSFETHILFNYLMDFYQNEQIVKAQERNISKQLKQDQKLVRDHMLRFVIH